MKSQSLVKQDQTDSEQELKQTPELIANYTVNELSLASATGLDPSSNLVKHFAKSYPEVTVTTDVD